MKVTEEVRSLCGKKINILIPENEVRRIDKVLYSNKYRIVPELIFKFGSPTVCFDIGANVGLFSLKIKHLFPKCQIFCFEPFPPTYHLLTENLKSYDGLTMCNFGLFKASRDGELTIDPSNYGKNSIKTLDTKLNTTTVKLIKTSDFLSQQNLNQIDIVKVDTEGCEVEIIGEIVEHKTTVSLYIIETHSTSDERTIMDLLRHYKLISRHSEYTTSMLTFLAAN